MSYYEALIRSLIIEEKINKRRSRIAILSVNWLKRRLIVHTSNQFQKETEFDIKISTEIFSEFR